MQEAKLVTVALHVIKELQKQHHTCSQHLPWQVSAGVTKFFGRLRQMSQNFLAGGGRCQAPLWLELDMRAQTRTHIHSAQWEQSTDRISDPSGQHQRKVMKARPLSGGQMRKVQQGIHTHTHAHTKIRSCLQLFNQAMEWGTSILFTHDGPWYFHTCMRLPAPVTNKVRVLR